jgi:copper(I)-binding protein
MLDLVFLRAHVSWLQWFHLRGVKMRQIIALVAGALLAMSAAAADSGITVSDAWGRATAPGQDSGSIQFSIASQKEARLVSITSPSAATVEIHSMVHENGKMKMRAVESIALPAGKTVNLGKSGNHVMLLNLKQPLKAGDSVPFTLTVQFADKHKATVDAKAEIRPQGASHDKHDMGDMHDMKM